MPDIAPQSKPKVIRVNSIAPMMAAYFHDQALIFSEWYDMVYVSSPGAEHAGMRADGIRTEEIFIARPISPVQDLITLWKLFCFFRKEKPAIVHSVTPKAGLLSMTAAWLARVPVRIHTFTGLLFPWRGGVMHHILKLTDRITCLFATNINPEGQGVRQDLQKYGITRKPLPILGHGNIRGVNLEKYAAKGTRSRIRQSLGIPAEAFAFAFTGRLVKDKGINELVSAFAELADKHPSAHLLLIGPQEPELDPLQPETQELIAGHPCIHSPGSCSNVPEMLEAADAFVFPSYREGFPNALLEAQAMSLPCIATDICGCNEIIADGENGLLIPARAAAPLRDAMDTIISMPAAERSHMGHTARRQIEEKFTAAFVAKNLHHYYQQLLNK